jgi:hypothetical protein
MSLQNLLAIKRLQEHTRRPEAIRKLFEAAGRNLADAQITQMSADNRFDAAYKSILQCAMVGLWSHGFRTASSQPGHHQTAIQCLVLTMSVPTEDIIVLDALRKQRNLSDYEGDPITEAALASCLEEAARLLGHTENWLKKHHPGWLALP